VCRKLGAYRRHIQTGPIAQGILQYLAVSCPRPVWPSFGSWLRTIRPGILPSELVTLAALRNSLPGLLTERHTVPLFKEFPQERIDAGDYEALRRTGQCRVEYSQLIIIDQIIKLINYLGMLFG